MSHTKIRRYVLLFVPSTLKQPVQSQNQLHQSPLSSLKEPEGCQLCRAGVFALFKEMTTDESLSGQEFLITSFVCNTFENPDGCYAGVLTWWRQMARVIFTETGAAHVCNGLEPACDLSPAPPDPPLPILPK